MKYLLFLPVLSLCAVLMGQAENPGNSGEQVILDNDKLKVVEFTAIPQGEVCGAGMHHHEPHLTVVLTNAKVQITSEDGKSQIVEVPGGTAIWSESEMHAVTNEGESPTKMILVYLKE